MGPLLFLIYINYLPNASKKLEFYLFADDTNVYCESKDLPNLFKIANKEVRAIKRWLDANKLSLNINKTNYIIFHSSSRNLLSGSTIKIGKKHIKRVKFVKFLGLLLDEHLSWKYHLSELSKKFARTCGNFFKIRNLLSLDVLLCLYNALFLSFLQYGLIVWDQVKHMHHTLIQSLNYKKKLSELSHFSLACHPLFWFLKILNFSNFLKSLNSDFYSLFLTQLIKLRLVAFITSFYSIHLFISITQDRPVKVIYTCLE